MSSPTTQPDWIFLGAVPAKVQWEQDSFVTVYNEGQSSLFLITKSQPRPQDMLLFQYSFKMNSWSKYTVTSSMMGDLGYLMCKPMVMHQNKIYIFRDSDPKAIAILTICDNNQAILQQKQAPPFDLSRELIAAKAIMIGGQVHIMGGEGNSRHHLKYDPMTNSFETLHDDFWRIYGYGIIGLKDKILILAGSDGHEDSDIHHQYNINQNKWSRIDCKFPALMGDFGCTKILNGQYVALFGGYTRKHDMDHFVVGSWDGEFRDDIFIYSVEEKMFRKSKIKCPNKGIYQAITFCDREQDKITTFGYVRSRWIKCGMEDHLFLPEYLIRILCDYYSSECIHLFRDFGEDNDHDCGEHHKIDALKLLDF